MTAILLIAGATIFKGMTFIDKPIVLTPEDSGREFIGEAGAVVSGGVKLGPWKDRGDGVWEAPSPGFFFDQLWIGGRRAPCARLPAEGYLTVAGGEQRDYVDANAKRLGYLQEVTFTNDVVDALGELAEDELKFVQMGVIVKWSYARRMLFGYDRVKRRVSTVFHEPWVAEGTNHLEWDPKFTLVAFENVRTAFKVPGQWFLDMRGGKVLYRPLPGEKPETLVAYAPRHGLSSLVEIRGDPANGRYVENVVFRGISFEHASFDVRPGEGDGAHQIAQLQAASTDGGTIHAVGARNCRFENCRVAHTANHAFRLDDGCVSNRIVDCTMEDIGAGGVWMGEREPRSTVERPIVGRRFVFPTARTSTAFNLVSNCTIRTGGRYNPEGCGVAIADCSDSKVIHCDITDMRYTGISVGWTQGYQGSVAQRNEIAFNHIWNIGLGLMSDMSGVYLLGTSFGTTVHDNVVHDVRTYAYGGSGLYCDEGTEGVILERNVVWNTTDSNFYEHFGAGNIVRNNIFAWNREYGAIRFYRIDKHGVPSSLYFVNNIVLGDGCPLASPRAGRIFGVWANNVWYDLKGEGKAVFDSLTWTEWCKMRHETGSVFADPQFVDAKNFDFRLKPGSPALALGFVPWDISAAGRRNQILPL